MDIQRADHKLLKVEDGIASFAHVFLERMLVDEQYGVVAVAPGSTDSLGANISGVSVFDRPEWYRVAADALSIPLFERDAEGKPAGVIVIQSLLGTEVNTTDDAIVCAAQLCAWKLLYPRQELPSVKTPRPWSVELPA